jgi:Bacterial regulatory proteins, luxR family
VGTEEPGVGLGDELGDGAWSLRCPQVTDPRFAVRLRPRAVGKDAFGATGRGVAARRRCRRAGPAPARCSTAAKTSRRGPRGGRRAAHGLSNDQIAERLFLSPLTVKTHINRAMMKLAVRDRAQLVVLAYQNGLVRPGDRID